MDLVKIYKKSRKSAQPTDLKLSSNPVSCRAPRKACEWNMTTRFGLIHTTGKSRAHQVQLLVNLGPISFNYW